MARNKLKIDLDLNSKIEVLEILYDRLTFLQNIQIFNLHKDIEKITLIKKSKYSVEIEFKREFKENKDIIILQSILGDDYKRTAITYRDLQLGIENWNRLFIIKKYPDGKMKNAKIEDITKTFFSFLKLKPKLINDEFRFNDIQKKIFYLLLINSNGLDVYQIARKLKKSRSLVQKYVNALMYYNLIKRRIDLENLKINRYKYYIKEE